MTGMEGWEKEIEDAQYPNIHLFKVEELWDHTTLHEDCKGKWVVCSPETVKNYSAVAFLFARMLHQEQSTVPVQLTVWWLSQPNVVLLPKRLTLHCVHNKVSQTLLMASGT